MLLLFLQLSCCSKEYIVVGGQQQNLQISASSVHVSIDVQG
jgi:hypothetical protein